MITTRIYSLHEAYIAEIGRRSDERWLLKQCDDPEFYANLRQHSDLCTQVSNNARSSPFLRALNKVALQSMHLCGSMSCTDLASSIAFRLGWNAVVVGIVLLIAAPNILLMVFRSLFQYCDKLATSNSVGNLDADELGMSADQRYYRNWQMLATSKTTHIHQGKDASHDLNYCCPSMRWRKTIFFTKPLDPQPALHCESPAYQDEFPDGRTNTIKLV